MTFTPYLHWTLNDEPVLFSLIVLDSTLNFLLACFLVILICWLERFLTFSLDKTWAPRALKFSIARLALWRTALYSLVTFLRLCYVLIATSFHIGLILVIVVSLSSGQLAIELHNHHSFSPSRVEDIDDISQPLLSEERVEPKTRPRSKSKPDNIFIHPADSNIARADAFALQLGLGGETERVQGFKLPDGSAWEVGKGRDLAREMLSRSTKKTSLQKVLSV
jgi:hypothetical protein